MKDNDNENDYNNSIRVIKKLFNEINNELNDTPDEIITRIESERDKQEIDLQQN